MQGLSEKQRERLFKLAEVLEEGDLALLRYVMQIEEKVESLKLEKKGDDGYTPKKGVDYFDGKDGEDGEDYILTDKDKKEIARSIEVPVVEKVIEKTEVIKEQPIIKEVAVRDEPQEIVEKLESLKGEERLDKSAIKGLEALEKELKKTPQGKSMVAKGFSLYTNGTKRGNALSLNIIPGVGVSLTYDYAHGRNDVTINASASTSVLTATGTIDDSNIAFTFASEPAILVINGASYRQTGGAITWTWNSGTLTATLSSPVGSGGSVFGLA